MRHLRNLIADHGAGIMDRPSVWQLLRVESIVDFAVLVSCRLFWLSQNQQRSVALPVNCNGRRTCNPWISVVP
jgi:hypothetical protein